MNKRITEEQAKLVTENMRLVPHILKKLGILPSNYEFDDLIQLGNIGLMKAAITFDSSKAKFATYASTCIRNEIYMYLRKENKKIGTVYLQDEFYAKASDPTSVLTYEETIEDINARFVDRVSDCQILEEVFGLILNGLNSKEKIIMLYYISKLPQSKISERLKLSQSYISRLQQKTRIKLDSLMKEDIKYEEKYAIKIIREGQNIMFIINDVEDLYLFSKEIIDKLKDENIINNFSLKCKDNNIVIELPADFSSFCTIAEIVEIIEKFK